jgi:hypothetical protein
VAKGRQGCMLGLGGVLGLGVGYCSKWPRGTGGQRGGSAGVASGQGRVRVCDGYRWGRKWPGAARGVGWV